MASVAPPTPDQVAKYVADVLSCEAPPDVVAAYLFGSCLDGDMRTDSDIDVGIVAGRDVWTRAGWVPWHLEAEVGRVLRGFAGHEFHVTVLSPRQVRFSFRVVAKGRRLWTCNGDAADDFVMYVARMYPDELYRYQQAEPVLIEELRQHGRS